MSYIEKEDLEDTTTTTSTQPVQGAPVAEFKAVKPCICCGAMDRYPRGGCRPCSVRRELEKRRLNGVKPIGLVQGVGVYEAGEFVCIEDGNVTKEYALWGAMLQRCYSEKYHAKQPTYVGCSVSEMFKNFQQFAKWVVQQAGYGLTGWQLDKDLIYRGNKIYSENTCVFLPRNINMLLSVLAASRGNMPIGVSKGSGKFRAECSNGSSKTKHLGTFPTPELAFAAYKIFKEALIKQRANEYKAQLDPRSYAALMSYEVSITD